MNRRQQRAVQRLTPKVDAILASDGVWAAAHPDRQHRIRLVRAVEVEMIELTQLLPKLERGARRYVAVIQVAPGIRNRLIFSMASDVANLPEAEARAIVCLICTLNGVTEVPAPC